ncbi:MAG TPA: GerW family sporulation protein [Limnochordia bacterium]|nr:GerW family sporulation protein [Limnochordia bacterium]
MDETRHPIEGLMQTAMESIKSIVDVNTILGDPVETPDGSVIVPVSRVSLGFAAGGTEYESGGKQDAGPEFPFGGGSGAGISVSPVAFLVVGQGEVRLLPVDGNAIFDRLIDLAPRLIEQLKGLGASREGNGTYHDIDAP